METIHLRIQNVCKSFGKINVLNKVSLDVPRGSFTTFLGPSGCGKTTLLRTIAGFYVPDGGEIYLGDRLLNTVPSHLRNTIMVFQDYALFPHMTIEENITYGLRIRKTPKDEIQKRLERTLGYLGIGNLLDRMPGQISGGQQQRVALARALIMEPEILLLDEPLSNLDAKLRINIRAELRQLQQRLKITTIYVTHDQAEALALSDRIAVMNEGKIVHYGTPRELYYSPANEFVASFIGKVNLIRGKVDSITDGMVRVKVGTSEFLLQPAQVSRTPNIVRAGKEVILCVRPETIRIEKGIQASDVNTFQGVVTNYIFEGATIRYWVEAFQKELVIDVFDPPEVIPIDHPIPLRFKPERIHLLPGE